MNRARSVSAGSANSDEQSPLLQPSSEGSASSSESEIVRRSQCSYLEPVAIALSFGCSVSGIVLANQVIYQTCVYQGYNHSLCLLLGTNANSTEVDDLETAVQPSAAKITMTSNVLISVIPALCGLLMGPWSDRFGRKPVIIIPCIGYCFTFILKSIICQLSARTPLDPWFYVVADIPAAFSGGSIVVIASLFSFLTDVTTEKNRTVRMGIMQACNLTGSLFGMMSSSFILRMVSASTVFVISAFMMLFSIGYVHFFIVDSVIQQDADAYAGTGRMLREIFRFDLLRDMFNTFCKKRSGYDRGIIWLTVGIGAVTVLGTAGGNVFYLFTRKQFDWTLQDYTFWQSSELLSIIVGNFVGIAILKKVFEVPDLAIALLSVLCFAGDSFIKGLARHGWQLYMATGVTPLKGTEGAALMAICSSILPPNDIAKIYSMGLSTTAAIPLVAAPLFTYIYSCSLKTMPELFNFIASGIFVVNLLFVGIIHVLLKRRHSHHRLYRDLQLPDDDDRDEVLA
ncbi:tetracycline resistance protein, class E-like [Toxorhynchites rutilus septentrionalis]|uniref:tetracycline resistance protein, class E-like n=1 Tax=Toxorhynchites rutilus septentrionalis TaxID=329112 RepID=UPI00247AB81D|nr:tetracycline resistance protein, class E-like [Toxorhynchites rutilus septentrionalis]